MNAGQRPPCGASLVQAVVAANGTGRQGLATKADIAELKVDFAKLAAKFAVLEDKFSAAINKMLLGQLATAGLLFATLKLF